MRGMLRVALGAGASAAVIAGSYAAGVALAPVPVDAPAGESPRQSRLATPDVPRESTSPRPVDTADEGLDDTEVANAPAATAGPRRERADREPRQATPTPGQSDRPEPKPSLEPTTTAEPGPEPSEEPTEEPTPTEEPEPTEEPSPTEEPPATTAPPETPQAGAQVP